MICKLATAAATGAVAAVALAVPAQADAMRFDGHRCSVHTLDGAYSGNISGTTATGAFNFQATTVFYGDGTGEAIKVTRADASGVTTYTAELDYTLAEDCTGTLTVHRSTGAVANYVIAVTDGGANVSMLQTDPGFIAAGVIERVRGHR